MMRVIGQEGTIDLAVFFGFCFGFAETDPSTTLFLDAKPKRRVKLSSR
jgi:hypothetical protein